MIIHLVGGFLGSGKTTGITNACKILSDNGISASVITNDQGKYLVDSRFIKYADIPVAEVTGGCFCCNYNELDSQITSLIDEINPSVIFAEFVGSCTDLVSTVLKPLLEYKQAEIERLSFSTYTDAQMLLLYLEGKPLPFSMETNYIWEKQIEESEILIVNKIDLLSKIDLDKLKNLAKAMYPTKQLLFQYSLDKDSVNNWVDVISNLEPREHKTIEIDYAKYGAGESNLAWLDEEIEIINSDNNSVELAYNFINQLSEEIVRTNLPIGHLKFYMSYNDQSKKISFTTVSDKSGILPDDGFEKSASVNLLINARIQTTPNILREILFNNLNQLKSQPGVIVNEKFLSYFQPGCPNPVHRFQ